MEKKRKRRGMPIMNTVSARLAGTTIKENVLSGETQFRTLKSLVERFHLSTTPCHFQDGTLIAESLGCKVLLQDHSPPSVATHPVQTIDDVNRLKMPDPTKDGRTPEFLKCAQLMAQHFPNVAKSASIGAPFSTAANLAGVQDLALKTITDPEFVKALVEFCLEIAVVHAHSFLEAGANTIFLGDPVVSILDPKAYEQFAAGPTRKFVERVNAPVSLHICGNTTHIIEAMCKTGVKAISIDAAVDMPAVAPKIPQNVIILGNLDPVGIIYKGKPEQVKKATWDMMDSMRAYPNYRPCTGCDLPYDTPLENIEAMIEAIETFE